MTRDKAGRFIKGVSGNPNGRPPKEREEKYTEILKNAVTFEQFGRVVKRIADKAEKGDMQASKLLMELLTIPMAKRIEITGADGGPVSITQIEIVKPEGWDDD
jgi:hypothetical protein